MAGLVESGFTGTINIGMEDTVTLFELVSTICKVAGRDPKLVTDTTRPEGRRIKSADSTALRRAYPGFCKSITLEDGLARMLGWYRETFNALKTAMGR